MGFFRSVQLLGLITLASFSIRAELAPSIVQISLQKPADLAITMDEFAAQYQIAWKKSLSPAAFSSKTTIDYERESLVSTITINHVENYTETIKVGYTCTKNCPVNRLNTGFWDGTGTSFYKYAALQKKLLPSKRYSMNLTMPKAVTVYGAFKLPENPTLEGRTPDRSYYELQIKACDTETCSGVLSTSHNVSLNEVNPPPVNWSLQVPVNWPFYLTYSFPELDAINSEPLSASTTIPSFLHYGYYTAVGSSISEPLILKPPSGRIKVSNFNAIPFKVVTGTIHQRYAQQGYSGEPRCLGAVDVVVGDTEFELNTEGQFEFPAGSSSTSGGSTTSGPIISTGTSGTSSGGVSVTSEIFSVQAGSSATAGVGFSPESTEKGAIAATQNTATTAGYSPETMPGVDSTNNQFSSAPNNAMFGGLSQDFALLVPQTSEKTLLRYECYYSNNIIDPAYYVANNALATTDPSLATDIFSTPTTDFEFGLLTSGSSDSLQPIINLILD